MAEDLRGVPTVVIYYTGEGEDFDIYVNAPVRVLLGSKVKPNDPLIRLQTPRRPDDVKALIEQHDIEED